MANEKPHRRLRKQPKRQRMQSASAVNLPQLKMPKTAQKRRRRKKTEPVRFGLSTLKRILLSSRWLSLGLLLVTIFALVEIYEEKRFYLTHIPVEGAVALSPEEIVRISGLAGSHVFAADPSDAAKKIGALPGVISATVTLKWPNEVYIQVAEETPVAIWFENGVEYGITQNGRLIPAIRIRSGLIQIESEMAPVSPSSDGGGTPGELGHMQSQSGDRRENGLAPGSSGSLTEPNTRLAFVPKDVLDGVLQLRELKPNVDKFYYKPSGGLSIQDERGWRGYFGTGVQMHQKIAVYESIVTDLLSRGIQPAYISVSNQEKPYFKAQ